VSDDELAKRVTEQMLAVNLALLELRARQKAANDAGLYVRVTYHEPAMFQREGFTGVVERRRFIRGVSL
jgi:hypothetical protein